MWRLPAGRTSVGQLTPTTHMLSAVSQPRMCRSVRALPVGSDGLLVLNGARAK